MKEQGKPCSFDYYSSSSKRALTSSFASSPLELFFVGREIRGEINIARRAVAIPKTYQSRQSTGNLKKVSVRTDQFIEMAYPATTRKTKTSRTTRVLSLLTITSSLFVVSVVKRLFYFGEIYLQYNNYTTKLSLNQFLCKIILKCEIKYQARYEKRETLIDERKNCL